MDTILYLKISSPFAIQSLAGTQGILVIVLLVISEMDCFKVIQLINRDEDLNSGQSEKFFVCLFVLP